MNATRPSEAMIRWAAISIMTPLNPHVLTCSVRIDFGYLCAKGFIECTVGAAAGRPVAAGNRDSLDQGQVTLVSRPVALCDRHAVDVRIRYLGSAKVGCSYVALTGMVTCCSQDPDLSTISPYTGTPACTPAPLRRQVTTVDVDPADANVSTAACRSRGRPRSRRARRDVQADASTLHGLITIIPATPGFPGPDVSLEGGPNQA